MRDRKREREEREESTKKTFLLVLVAPVASAPRHVLRTCGEIRREENSLGEEN